MAAFDTVQGKSGDVTSEAGVKHATRFHIALGIQFLDRVLFRNIHSLQLLCVGKYTSLLLVLGLAV